MTAVMLDGKKIAAELRREMKSEVSQFVSRTGVTPKLCAILVGDDPASQVYVRNKHRACEEIGIASDIVRMPAETSETALLAQLDALNCATDVHAILVQLPLPRHLDTTRVLDRVSAAKDVDCFHPDNVGRLMQGRPRFLPCTPHGVLQVLHRSGIPAAGREVVVVGRSDIVGKPLAALLMQKSSHLGADAVNATVTVAHSRTPNLAEITRRADILVAAIGSPKFVTAEMVKAGAVVVDVGINRTVDGLVGDVDFETVRQVASHITPVPGGIGPLTIAMLLRNTIDAAMQQTRIGETACSTQRTSA